jgi:hypothetical protein
MVLESRCRLSLSPWNTGPTWAGVPHPTHIIHIKERIQEKGKIGEYTWQEEITKKK